MSFGSFTGKGARRGVLGEGPKRRRNSNGKRARKLTEKMNQKKKKLDQKKKTKEGKGREKLVDNWLQIPVYKRLGKKKKPKRVVWGKKGEPAPGNQMGKIRAKNERREVAPRKHEPKDWKDPRKGGGENG